MLEDVSHQMEVGMILQNQNMVVSVMTEVVEARDTDSQTQLLTLTLILTQTADTDFAQAQEAVDPDTYSK
jgi:hypothetical protein